MVKVRLSKDRLAIPSMYCPGYPTGWDTRNFYTIYGREMDLQDNNGREKDFGEKDLVPPTPFQTHNFLTPNLE
jgi:hypothetical protein